jgi:DNA polymerase elongation subunit (family B)
MIEYCMIDSKATCEVWMVVEGTRKMDCMTSAFRSCTLDTMVYSTGVMTSCLVSSNLLSRSMYMDWSMCSTVVDFKGGYVMDPIVDTYFNIMMADFNSMYPSIMIGCNISVETVRWRPARPSESDGDVTVTRDGKVTCIIGREAVWFDTTDKGVMSGMLEELIRVRSKYKKGKQADQEFSFALKVATNSMFGTIGYVNSPMYSPRASACVTSIGRYCLMDLMNRLVDRRLNVDLW